MTQLTAFLADSFALFTVLSVIETLCSLGTCVILTMTVFGLDAKLRPVPVAVSVFLSVLYSVFRVMRQTGRTDMGIDMVLSLIIPFVCMTLFFFSKQVWKSYIAALALNITGAVKYLVLMGLPDYDFVNPDYYTEFLIEAPIEIFTFAVLLAVYLLYVRKYRKTDEDFTRHLPVMMVLIVLTTVLFVTSLVITGTNFSPERRAAYFFSLLCFPAFGATVYFSVRTVIRSSLAESSYRKMLDMQLKHFNLLEGKNDELRIFRHDFPKQMAPLLMYIRNGNTAEAEKIVEGFNVTVQGTRSRFNTGCCQLDTVLECEQQLASKNGVEIQVIEGSVFPAEGIQSEDIYTVFPNALDNAIEACALLGSDAVITFESHIQGSMVFVRITNPYDGNLKIGSNGLKTRKKDKEHHGFGVRSMQKAMSAYGTDNLSYETKNGRITLNLVFDMNY